MILPDLPDYPDALSSPGRPESPLTMWKRANGFDTTPMQQFDLGAPGFAPGSVTPTTPIIYGNGTMLSDIGEVTEAESTTGSILRNKKAYHGPSYEALHAQPPQPLTSTPAYEAAKRRVAEQRMASRERRSSIESTSTVTNGDRPGVFADFDDSVSVDDSVFQGDDEDSVAESYVYNDLLQPGERTPVADALADRTFIAGQERYSTALSRRAEQILANAKQRLTVSLPPRVSPAGHFALVGSGGGIVLLILMQSMEGNLSRARSSMSSYGSSSTPSPPLARVPTALHRDHDPAIQKHPLGHSRISSENNIPSEIKAGHTFPPRSSSAMGAGSGQRQPLTISRSAEYMRDRTKHDSPLEGSFYASASYTKSKPPLYEDKHFLEPLSEDEGVPELESPGTSNGDATLDSFLSPTFGPYQGQELRRSASTAQMRDLKHQMSDLKGRLSSLRDQARADSMQRRSLSSLRTPSPFTHARVDQWYATRNTDAGDGADGGIAETDRVEGEVRSLEVNAQAVRPHQLSSEGESLYTDFDERSPRTKLFPAEAQSQSPGKSTPPAARAVDESLATDDDDADGDDMKTEDGYDDDNDGFVDIESVAGTDSDSVCDSESTCETVSESGESLYHDSVQNQLSHEDREDAFDYEHFFLHSAMGSMSQKKMRSESVSSYSSEDSVETTRGPILPGNNRRRRGSDASVSTTASFATATEGRLTRAGTSAQERYSEEMVSPTYPGSMAAITERARSHTPETGKRLTFGFNGMASSGEGIADHSRESMVRRPQSSAATFTKRPSVSSLGSTGTNRSFPLVNRHSKANGILTPNESPDHELKQLSNTLMSETASICDRESISADDTAISHLAKEDQILVQRLVASLGKCVLGLSESGRASTESRMYRRRLDAARRTLEGME